MAPFFIAETLFRMMNDREEKVKMAHVFYLEYLAMLDHYGVLDKDQKKTRKMAADRHRVVVM